MRVALYARVSTDRQAEQGVSIEDQLAQMEAWAKRGEHDIVQVYVEPGASAFDDKGRPIFDDMIEAAISSEHPFDAIVVHTKSRFYRLNTEREVLELRLEKRNVKVISITQPTPEDDDTAFVTRNIFGIMDELNSRQNSKHTTRCARRNAEQGFVNGAKPPYGYTTFATEFPARSGFKKRLAIKTEEAEVVRLIFQLAREGETGIPMGTKRIAECLNKRGLQRRGKAWRKQGIDNILRDTTYVGIHATFKREAKTGKLRPEGEWVKAPAPAIIDQDHFRKVQEGLQSRQLDKHESRAEQVPTLLTGVLKCGRCGKSLTLMTGKSGKYNYYRCRTKLDSGVLLCDCPNLPKEEFEQAVCTALAERVLVTERITSTLEKLQETLAKSSDPDRKHILALQQTVASLDEKLSVWYEQREKKEIEMDGSLINHIASLQGRRLTAIQEIELLRKRQQMPIRKFGEPQVSAFAEAARNALLDPAAPIAKTFLRAVVSEIRVRKADAIIGGSRFQLAHVISKWKPGNPIVGVPSNVSQWRAWQDSNPRPLGS